MSPRIVVALGEVAAAAAPAELAALGLGSCVAVTLWDPEAHVGGMAHILLPAPPPGRPGPPARYASSAIPILRDQVRRLGAEPTRLSATLVGGSAMFAALQPPGSIQTGERNVVAAREALRAAGIPIRGEWVGGQIGRSVRFDLSTGVVLVSSVRHGTREL